MNSRQLSQSLIRTLLPLFLGALSFGVDAQQTKGGATEILAATTKRPLKLYENPEDKTAKKEIPLGKITFPIRILDNEGDSAFRIEIDGERMWVKGEDVRLKRGDPVATCLTAPKGTHEVGAARGANKGCAAK